MVSVNLGMCLSWISVSLRICNMLDNLGQLCASLVEIGIQIVRKATSFSSFGEA